MADFLVIQDLYDRVGSRKVNGYFDDNNNGVITDNTSGIDVILSAAEAEMYARLIRAYPGDPSVPGGPMQLLVENDPALKMHTVSIALQYAAERRPEFTDEDGVGPFKTPYDRAISYFDTLSKGLTKSMGQTQAGPGATSGGTIQPKPPAASQQQFVFASSRNSPRGHGGFIIPLALSFGEMLRVMVTLT